MKSQKKPLSHKRFRQNRYRPHVSVKKYLPYVVMWLKIILFLATAIAVVYFLLTSERFHIKKLSIIGADRFVSYDDIKNVISTNTEGKNLFTFKVDDLQKTLQESFLGAKKITIQKQLPDSLKVLVQERVPIAIVYRSEDEQYLIDMEGYVLGYTSADNTELPRMKYEDPVSVGLFIDRDLVPIYIELTNLLESENIKVSSMSFYHKYVGFTIEDGIDVLIGLDKNLHEMTKALSALLRKTKLESKELLRIDLRYDKVIVLFK